MSKWTNLAEWRENNAAAAREQAAIAGEQLKRGPDCPYCSGPSELVDGSVIYPHRNDIPFSHYYLCSPCQAWVGCHPKTKTALGSLANRELRFARKEAHRLFDPIWKNRVYHDRVPQREARTDAYAWLAEQMGLPRDHCHIGSMDLEACRRAIYICKARKASRHHRRNTSAAAARA